MIDIINCFVINYECVVGMFQGGVGSQDGVVGFDYCCRDLRCWVDCKLKFGFFFVVNRKVFYEEGGKVRFCIIFKGMKD